MIILILILLGLCFGSFVNALIWRLHMQSKQLKKKKSNYSIVSGRSMCMSCGHTLSVIDLVPVASWVLLRGRCRYCHKKYPDTPVAELITPILFVVSYVFWPDTLDDKGITLLIFWLVFLVGFVALAIYDLRWFKLPNKIIFPLMIVAGVQVVLSMLFFNFSAQDLGSLLVSIGLGGGIFYALYYISHGKWIGGGDVKLGFLLGAILGNPLQSILLIFIASLLGTLVSLPLLLAKRLKYRGHVPFGPFLLAAAVIVRLFGASIIDGYMRLLGL